MDVEVKLLIQQMHSMDRDAILRSGQDSAGFGPQAARGKEVRP